MMITSGSRRRQYSIASRPARGGHQVDQQIGQDLPQREQVVLVVLDDEDRRIARRRRRVDLARRRAARAAPCAASGRARSAASRPCARSRTPSARAARGRARSDRATTARSAAAARAARRPRSRRRPRRRSSPAGVGSISSARSATPPSAARPAPCRPTRGVSTRTPISCRSAPTWRRSSASSSISMTARPASDASPSAAGASTRRWSRSSTLRGSVSVKREPEPTTLSKVISPPMRRARRLAIARPSPVPPWRRAIDWSTWKNSSNTLALAESGMPTPVSVTWTATRSPRASADTWTWPVSVNLMALPIRLVRIWRTRLTSQRTVGRSSGRRACRSRPLASASGTSVPTVARICARDVGGLQIHLQMPRLDARQVEDVVDEPQQVLPVALDDLEVAPLIVRQRARHAVAQQLRQRQHRVERRADLVAHVGDEGALEAVGLLAAPGLLDQLGALPLQLLALRAQRLALRAQLLVVRDQLAVQRRLAIVRLGQLVHALLHARLERRHRLGSARAVCLERERQLRHLVVALDLDRRVELALLHLGRRLREPAQRAGHAARGDAAPAAATPARPGPSPRRTSAGRRPAAPTAPPC